MEYTLSPYCIFTTSPLSCTILLYSLRFWSIYATCRNIFLFSHFHEKSHLIKNTNGGLRKTWFTHSKPCEFLFSLSVINSSLHLLFLFSLFAFLFLFKPYAQYLFGYCATLNSILKDIVSLLNSSIQEYMARRSFLIHYCSLCFISLFMKPWPSLCRTSFDLFYSLWRHFCCEIVHRSS